MPRIVVVGGGWAGCAAAISARKAGGEVVLIERTDCLLGTGLVGGIMRNNGRFTAAEEMMAMGGGDLFELADNNARHANVAFPGHQHASLYDVALMEPAVRRHLAAAGVQLQMMTRVCDVNKTENGLEAVVLSNGERVEGDVFVEATGTAGPERNCRRYGNGCVMCVLRCPAWGGRVSIAERAGVREMKALKADGSVGAMSGSCKLHKDSIDRSIASELNRTGVAVVPIPRNLISEDKLAIKACQQYALSDYAQNLVLLDTGHVKLMTSFFPVAELRSVPGLENARYEDPYAGGKGNSVRLLAMSPRDDHLQVRALDNLFCAGEKAGPLIGHTEAICTGTLAGHNAVRQALGRSLAAISRSTAVGDAIAYSREQMEADQGVYLKYTFSGSTFFQRMTEKSLYTTDVEAIRRRVAEAGFESFFDERLV